MKSRVAKSWKKTHTKLIYYTNKEYDLGYFQVQVSNAKVEKTM